MLVFISKRKRKERKEKKFAFEPGIYWYLIDVATLACLRVGKKELCTQPFTQGLLTANTWVASLLFNIS